MPAVASDAVFAWLLRLMVIASGESKPGVALPSSKRDGGLSSVDWHERFYRRDAAVLDRFGSEILCVNKIQTGSTFVLAQVSMEIHGN